MNFCQGSLGFSALGGVGGFLLFRLELEASGPQGSWFRLLRV